MPDTSGETVTSDSVSPPGSAFVLAFHKSGSQWVRDVLWDPAVLDQLGLEPGQQGVDAQDWPGNRAGQIHAPVYSVSRPTWANRKRRGERAVIVLRDPRDMAVSWISSVTHSHAEQLLPAAIRTSMRNFEPREQLLAALIWLRGRTGAMHSWAGYVSTPYEYITSYERLISDSHREFGNIVQFLDGDAQSTAITASIERHSFTARSGRQPGIEDTYSHYRVGVAGDWVRWFDWSVGRLFESLFPSLLVDLGYESSPDWFERLAKSVEVALPTPAHEAADLLVELRRVQEENQLLRRVCDERLSLIESLDKRVQDTLRATEPSESEP